MQPKTKKQWKDVGKSMRGVYIGYSARTQRRHDKDLREKEEADAVERKSKRAGVMHQFFTPAPRGPAVAIPNPVPVRIDLNADEDVTQNLGYESDLETESRSDTDSDSAAVSVDTVSNFLAAVSVTVASTSAATVAGPQLMFHIQPPPPLKRRKLEILY
ncbi:hypothetical protein L218DRAFT_947589 [Marasmius fiardii PR-910]|nr:hypothetical protein L218DRAFT_947589 [Marasmius fiardii PR-910]